MLPFTEQRPWGSFRQYSSGAPVTVKTLEINPGQSLSLQYHEKREEFWVVLFGQPEITIGEKVVHARPGEEYTVPVRAIHRIRAMEEAVKILEISTGEFSEQDIVRLADDYQRI